VAVAVTVARVADRDSAAEGLRTETVDLSPDGALLRIQPGALRVGDQVDLTLALPWQASAVSAQAQVVRRAGAGVALRFTAMSQENEASLAAFVAAAQFALAPSRL
jgi:c-di-GMP-binding flagellar brake protein YcgR